MYAKTTNLQFTIRYIVPTTNEDQSGIKFCIGLNSEVNLSTRV